MHTGLIGRPKGRCGSSPGLAASSVDEDGWLRSRLVVALCGGRSARAIPPNFTGSQKRLPEAIVGLGRSIVKRRTAAGSTDVDSCPSRVPAGQAGNCRAPVECSHGWRPAKVGGADRLFGRLPSGRRDEQRIESGSSLEWRSATFESCRCTRSSRAACLQGPLGLYQTHWIERSGRASDGLRSRRRDRFGRVDQARAYPASGAGVHARSALAAKREGRRQSAG